MDLARHFQAVPCWGLLFWFKGWTIKVPFIYPKYLRGVYTTQVDCMMDKPDDEHPRTKVEQSPKTRTFTSCKPVNSR